MIARLKVGSKLFCENYKDDDLLIIVEDDMSDKQINSLREIYKSNQSTDTFVHRVSDLNKNLFAVCNWYIAQLLKEGRIVELEGKFPLEPNDKELCLSALHSHAFDNVRHINGGASKMTYYVLLVLYYFRHGNTLLTDEEKKEVQLAHDGYYPLEKLPALKAELEEILARL